MSPWVAGGSQRCAILTTMCGRYSAILGPGDFDEHGLIVTRAAWLAFFSSWTPRYNVAPTQTMPIAVTQDEILPAEWGLRPHWKKTGPPLFNSRGETVGAKFRSAFEDGRCLVFACGFYEWKKAEGRKIPYRLTRTDGKPFAFAGVADSKSGVTRFSILTTTPNELVAPIHNRMPVILDRDGQHAWLASNRDEASSAIVPFPAALMNKVRVSTAVNSWKNDTREVVRALPEVPNEE